MTPEQVKDYWKNQAIKYGDSYEASWTDKYAMELETQSILKEIEGNSILDIGCANGHKTMELAKKLAGCHFTAMDYVPEMIEMAKTKYNSIKSKLCSEIDFRVGDILNIDEPENRFDIIIVVRVLINLSNKEQQYAAIKECTRVLKPFGKLIISEATIQGWQNLNFLRNWFGMSAIPIPEFNNYINETDILDGHPGLSLYSINNFSSTYFLGTRILKPLLIDVLKYKENPADPNSEINKLFASLPAVGDYGTQKMFVFKKAA